MTHTDVDAGPGCEGRYGRVRRVTGAGFSEGLALTQNDGVQPIRALESQQS